jgi:hypothetical protein
VICRLGDRSVSLHLLSGFSHRGAKRGGKVGSNGLNGGRDRRYEDFAEEVINNSSVAYDKIMAASADDVGRFGKPDGENFVPASVDMEKRLGDLVILPIDDGIDGPGDKTVVASPDHVPHELIIFPGSHGYHLFNGGEGFYEGGGSKLLQPEAVRPSKVGRQAGRYRDAANQDSADGGK